MKHWVIPDIHGCVDTLKTLFEDYIKPSASDHIYFLGDYIDRGPGGKEVIDFIISLQKKAFNVVPLMGNHEDYLLRAYRYDSESKPFLGIKTKSGIQKEWEKQGGGATLKSFGVKWPAEIPEEYISWIMSLPFYHELEKFILVHAGFNFEIENPFEDKNYMLWVRDFAILPEKIKHKKIIHGHVPVDLEFIDKTIKSEDQPFIDLDNGIYLSNRNGYGNLVALELTEMKYVIQPCLDEINY